MKVVAFIVTQFDTDEYPGDDNDPRGLVQAMVEGNADWPDDVTIVIKQVDAQ